MAGASNCGEITTIGGYREAWILWHILLVVLLEFLRRIGKEFDSYVLRDFQARLSVISTDTRGTDPRQLLYGRHRCSSSFAQSFTPRLSVLRTSSFASSLGPGWVSSSVTRLETRLLGG